MIYGALIRNRHLDRKLIVSYCMEAIKVYQAQANLKTIFTSFS